MYNLITPKFILSRQNKLHQIYTSHKTLSLSSFKQASRSVFSLDLQCNPSLFQSGPQGEVGFGFWGK
jgi:hypothetical protein